MMRNNIKYALGLLALMIISIPSIGQTSIAEKTGDWTIGSSWVGGTTLTSNIVVIDGTMEALDNILIFCVFCIIVNSI